jgi:hypothetical protein
MPDDLEALRAQTLAFIEENPIDVTLMREFLSGDGQGGSLVDRQPIDEQHARLIPQDYKITPRISIDGRALEAEYVLLLPYDADVEIDDTFRIGVRDYKIIWVKLDKRYEAWAEVATSG